MGNSHAKWRAGRLRNPAYRAQAGLAGSAPVFISTDAMLIIDQFEDQPGKVRIDATVTDTVCVYLPVKEAVDMATAVLARFHTGNGLVSPVELSVLTARHRPVVVPQCRVCGHVLTIASMGGGDATKYVCDSPEASMFGRGSLWGPEADAAAEHRRRSEVRISYHGDSGLVAVLAELRRLRQLLGEDMDVPVGTVHYPDGHGKHVCSWNRLRHDGNDVWTRDPDFEFTHDPSHATLEWTAPEEAVTA